MMNKLHYEEQFREMVSKHHNDEIATPLSHKAKSQMFDKNTFPEVPETPIQLRGLKPSADAVFDIVDASGAGGSAPTGPMKQ